MAVFLAKFVPLLSLLYYTSLPVWPYSYPTKPVKVPSYSKHEAEASVSLDTYLFIQDFTTDQKSILKSYTH